MTLYGKHKADEIQQEKNQSHERNREKEKQTKKKCAWIIAYDRVSWKRKCENKFDAHVKYIYISVSTTTMEKKRTTHQRLTFTVRVQCFISRLTGEKANESKTEYIQWNENNGLSGSSSHCYYDVTLCIHAIHWKCVNYMLKSSDSNDTAATIDVPKDHQMFLFSFIQFW